MVKISVVIPVYGVEKYLGQMLDSIRRQGFRDAEYILVDDGSPDACPQMLDEFAKEDSRYTVIHQKNAGVSAARNTGLAEATGEYVYLADSDDWLADGALESLWEAAEKTGADLIYGDWIGEYAKGPEPRICFPKEFCTTDPDTIKTLQCAANNNNNVRLSRPEFSHITHLGGAPWRCMMRRALIAENALSFDPYVKGMADDILFTLHLYEHVRKVAYIQVPIYHYRIVDESLTRVYKADLLQRYDLIFERMEQFLRRYHKDEMAWQAYYLRVLLYLDAAMKRYFKSPSNPKPEEERRREFMEVLGREPYRTALKKAPVAWFYKPKTRLKYGLLQHCPRMYWALK